MKTLLLGLMTTLSLFSHSYIKKFTFSREDGSIVYGYSSIPRDAQSICLFITPPNKDFAKLIDCFTELYNYSPFSIGVVGLNLKKSFEHSPLSRKALDFTLEGICEDFGLLGKQLDQPIILIGMGEASRALPTIAQTIGSQVKGVVLISPGGGLSLCEEIAIKQHFFCKF